MKMAIVRLLGLFTIAGFAATGCVSHHHYVATPTGEVVVTTEPPAPRSEVIATAPGPGYVWVGGYWAHRHGRWVWMPGHYESSPTATAHWVPGHWDRTTSGWVWTPGRWD